MTFRYLLISLWLVFTLLCYVLLCVILCNKTQNIVVRSIPVKKIDYIKKYISEHVTDKEVKENI